MRKLLLAAALAAASVSPSFANGDSGYSDAGVKAGDWIVRLRGIGVVPDDDGSLNGLGYDDHSVDTAIVPELDFTYFITDNIAAELILATAKHHVTATGDGGAAGDRVEVGEVWLLPPTLTLQYHFTDFGPFKPYLGAGVNYTIFYNEDAQGGVVSDFEIDNTFAFALQAGVDYEIENGIYLNADVKRIFLEADISTNVGVSGDAGIQPWVFGLGVGYRF